MIYLQNLLENSGESIPLTAIIDTALSVGSGGSTGSLADKPIVRTAENRLLIPASQLKGRLRHECEKLARGLCWPICESPNPQTMCPQRSGFSVEQENAFHRQDYWMPEDERHHCLICQIFGNPSLPSRVVVDDLICTAKPDILPEVLRPGVTINRRRGTAEDKKLYFLETSPVNAQLQFKGAIYLQRNAPIFTKALIFAALHHIHALGGSKSTGLGWLYWEFKDKLVIDDLVWSALLSGGEK